MRKRGNYKKWTTKNSTLRERKHLTLEQRIVMSGSPVAQRGEFDWGQPVGKEML